jgi:response regulator RpfG family c-di-GMP phosphodiesterase
VGKLSTPEWVMNKSTKLETIFDRINLIKTRFETLQERARKQGEEEKVAFLKELALNNNNDPMIVESTLEAIDSRTEEKIQKLEDDLHFIESCNEPGEFLDEDKRERLDRILKKGGVVGEEITDEEHKLLSISKGTLTSDEREIMQQHVVWTGKLLEQVPFRGELKDVPVIAAQHHERLNGQGYPDGLRAEQLSLPSRILAVADVFEALSAKDRPYRKPLPVSKVVEILKRIAQEGELDEEIVAFIEQEQLAQEFEAREEARSH